MDVEFKSLNELYLRIKPALLSKRQELVRAGYNYIKEEDIWNSLKEKKWTKTFNLSLAEIVNDILNADIYLIDNYIKNKMNGLPREVNLEEPDSLL